MRKERWQKIEEIFSAAAEIRSPEREAFLRSICGDDAAMLAEVNILLDEHEKPSNSLDTPVFEIGLQMIEDDAAAKRTGTTIGQYRFGRLIGRGGMGEIYEAEDTELGRKVAIKLVNELFALDAERIRRFRKEANAASRISHPNVAKLFELREIDGENIIVMELVDGINLRHFLANEVPLAKAIEIGIQIASALTAAHSVGVVHRDIKPENIIINRDGMAKILDFGLAKLVEPIGDGTIQIPGGEKVELTVDMSTELGALFGTPAYMSPEQIRGGGVGTQTDIWSFGVLLYEMVTGQLPFTGPTKIDVIAAILVSDPALIAEKVPVEGKLNTVFIKALRKETSERYQRVEELLDDLKQISTSFEPPPARLPENSISGTELDSLWRRRKKAIFAATILAALASIAIPVMLNVIGTALVPPSNGLIGHWPADGNVKDDGSGNGGVFINAAFAPGYLEQAFDLNGVDNYIEVPDSRTLSITGPLTLQARIKLTSNTAQQGIIEKYDEPGVNGYFLRLTESGTLQAGLCSEIGSGQTFATGATKVGTEDWHHVVAVYDGLTMNIYLDGRLDASANMKVSPTDGASSLKIGARGDDANTRFGGLIDEVKIHNRALSYAEILPVSGLVSYWPGDSNANDVVGKNDGQLSGAATFRSGVSGQAFSFVGVDDLLMASTDGLPTGNKDRTMAMWVTIDDTLIPNPLFGGYGRWGSYSQIYSLMATEGQSLAITNWGEGPGVSRLEPGQWYFIAATTDANSTSLYLNGKLVREQKLTLDTPGDTYFYSGGMPGRMGDVRRLKGAVDEIQIYDRALSADEIQTLFLAYKP